MKNGQRSTENVLREIVVEGGWVQKRLYDIGWSELLARGFRDQVATGGSLLGVVGACGWLVVQLDHDEELGPIHGMHGTLEAVFDVQRTIKSAELMAFLSLLNGSHWSYDGSPLITKGPLMGCGKEK